MSAAEALLNRIARPEILALEGYLSARKEAGAGRVILNANENPWAPDLDGAGDWELNRYPPPQPRQVVEQLAGLYGVDNAQVLVTRGSDEGIDLLTRAFCHAGRDRVVYCPPCFGMYRVSAAIQGAIVRAAPLRHDGWQPDSDAILAARPRLLFLCHPNNPTGNLIDEQAVPALCRELRNRALVIVDEAYIEFAGIQSLVRYLPRYPNLVVLRTLSKAWGLAGLRCGAILADPAIIRLLGKIMAPYPLSIATQALVSQALTSACRDDAQTRIEWLRRERERMFGALEKQSCVLQVWPSRANFLLVRVADAGHLVQAVARQGILLRDQSRQPGLANCVRITIGTREENDTLLEFLEDYDT